MKNSIKLWIGLSLCSLLFLSGCQGNSKTTSSVKKEEVQQSTAVASEKKESTEEKEEATAPLWNDEKKQQLKTFMATWETTMGQSYQEYQPGTNTNYYGIEVPDRLLQDIQMTVNQEAVSHQWWQENGDSTSYQIVAVYSDVEAGKQPFHLYLFTIKNDVPEVLVAKDSGYFERQTLVFAPTQNQELKAGFAKIVGNGTPKEAPSKEPVITSVPGYTNEEVLAARFYLSITQQQNKVNDGTKLELTGYPVGRKVANSEQTFPVLTYTLSAIPLAAGEWTFSEEKDGQVKYYALPKNYRDPKWLDVNFSNQEAKRILAEAQTITLGNYSQESLLSVLKDFEKF